MKVLMKTFFQFKILLLLSGVTDGLCGKGWKKEALKVLLENFWNIGWWRWPPSTEVWPYIPWTVRIKFIDSLKEKQFEFLQFI